MDDNNLVFIKKSIDIAIENLKKGGGPFGAIVVKNGRIIAESGNSVSIDNDATAHAEVNAIRKASAILKNFDLSGCSIYSSCEPCPMCLGAIYWARIDKLYFAASRIDAANAGFSDALIYNEINLAIEHRAIHTEQIQILQANLPFEKWSNMTDKTTY
jgi:guanine deaminase